MVMVSVLLAGASVLGGPIDKSQVSAGANWVAHVDTEQFNKSKIGQLIREELERIGVMEKLNDFATIFAFHPLNDVRDVTIYGNGKDREKAVVLVDGTFDKERLLALIGMNPEYGEIPYGDITLYKWLHEEKQGSEDSESHLMYGCFYTADMVVMSAGLEMVKNAVDVLKGTATNAVSGVFSQAALDAKGAILQVAANAVGETVGDEPQAAALRQTKELGIVAGEADGKLYVNVRLTAKSEEAAENVKKMLDGMIAFLTLAGEEQPKLAELVQKVEVSRAQNTVEVHFESDSESLVKFLEEEWERKQKEESEASKDSEAEE